HRGVLQVCTAGAGTAHRIPEDIEYLHCVQAALDTKGLRYQVLDIDGHVREQLSWPLTLPLVDQWHVLSDCECAAVVAGHDRERIVAFHFAGHAAPQGTIAPQTLLSAFDPGAQPRLWSTWTRTEVDCEIGAEP